MSRPAKVVNDQTVVPPVEAATRPRPRANAKGRTRQSLVKPWPHSHHENLRAQAAERLRLTDQS